MKKDAVLFISEEYHEIWAGETMLKSVAAQQPIFRHLSWAHFSLHFNGCWPISVPISSFYYKPRFGMYKSFHPNSTAIQEKSVKEEYIYFI